MAGILMRFVDGTEREVAEKDLIPAMASGAVQVNRYAIDPTLSPNNKPEKHAKEK